MQKKDDVFGVYGTDDGFRPYAAYAGRASDFDGLDTWRVRPMTALALKPLQKRSWRVSSGLLHDERHASPNAEDIRAIEFANRNGQVMIFPDKATRVAWRPLRILWWRIGKASPVTVRCSRCAVGVGRVATPGASPTATLRRRTGDLAAQKENSERESLRRLRCLLTRTNITPPKRD